MPAHALSAWLDRVILPAAVIAAPALVVSAVLAFQLHGTILDCVPHRNDLHLTDEVHYWNEINSFAHVGLRSGYFVADERPARASWTPFGPHGPGFPVAYGSLARLVGWQEASGPVFNAALLTAGAAFWLACCRLDRRRLITALFLLGSYWPCLLWMPATMQESFHCALAFALAGLAHPWLSGRTTSLRWIWPFLIVAALAALTRVSWALAMIPWLCVVAGGVPVRMRWLVSGVVVAAVAALAWCWQYITSPFPNTLRSMLSLVSQAPDMAFWTLLWRVQNANVEFLSFRSAKPLEVLQRYEACALVVVCAWMATRRAPAERRPFVFACLNVVLVAGLVISVPHIGDWQDHRVLGPQILLSLLVILSAGDWRLAAALAGLNLLFLPVFLGQFREFHQNRVEPDVEKIATFRAEIAPHLRYDPAASAWDNTLLVPVASQSYPMLALPPGIGLSFVVEATDLRSPIESRYVLVPPRPSGPWPGSEIRPAPARGGPKEFMLVAPRNAGEPTRLRLLAETSVGNLYLNLSRARADDGR